MVPSARDGVCAADPGRRVCGLRATVLPREHAMQVELDVRFRGSIILRSREGKSSLLRPVEYLHRFGEIAWRREKVFACRKSRTMVRPDQAARFTGLRCWSQRRSDIYECPSESPVGHSAGCASRVGEKVCEQRIDVQQDRNEPLQCHWDLRNKECHNKGSSPLNATRSFSITSTSLLFLQSGADACCLPPPCA